MFLLECVISLLEETFTCSEISIKTTEKDGKVIRSNAFFQPFFFRQTLFVLPGPCGSPPKILTFDQVRDAIKNVEDMQLAHEIVKILIYIKN